MPPEAASSVLFPAVMGWQQAARVLLTSDWVSADELVELGLALRGVRPGHRARRDGRAGGADRRASRAPRPGPSPRSCGRHGRDAVARGQPARAGRRSARSSAARSASGTLAEFAAKARRRVLTVRLGITAALTDHDLAPAALAAAVEELGFDSLWLPEHTHLPVREDTAARARRGCRASTTTSAASTRSSRWPRRPPSPRASGSGTGILLAAQHDPILLAKQVATLDHLSAGRVTLGVGYGWNRAEAEDHGVDFGPPPRRRRASTWRPWRRSGRRDQAEFHGEFVDFGPTWSWPKPVQQPRVRTLVGGGATDDRARRRRPTCADGWIPIGGSGLAAAIPRLRALAEEAGRDPAAADRRPLRDHRRPGQARALRRPRRHRGRAAHPGR